MDGVSGRMANSGYLKIKLLINWKKINNKKYQGIYINRL
jgi:hypothetical protein